MTRRNTLALAMLGLCVIIGPQTAAAQTNVAPMSYLDLTGRPDPRNEFLAIWSDQIAKTNARWPNETFPLNVVGNAPASVLWQKFRRAGRIITASIFLGAGCDGGPNDKDSQQGWSICPARITISDRDGEKTVQTQACYQYFPLRAGEEPPEGERSYASLDDAATTVSFSATQDGRAVPSCARSVRIPR
jgi:hypothetical protein